MDDQLWMESLKMERLILSTAYSPDLPSEKILLNLLRRGVSSNDERFDSVGYVTGRSWRYSAALCFRLWKMVQNERTKVHRFSVAGYSALTFLLIGYPFEQPPSKTAGGYYAAPGGVEDSHRVSELQHQLLGDHCSN